MLEDILIFIEFSFVKILIISSIFYFSFSAVNPFFVLKYDSIDNLSDLYVKTPASSFLSLHSTKLENYSL